jgi:hypothetical protein
MRSLLIVEGEGEEVVGWDVRAREMVMGERQMPGLINGEGQATLPLSRVGGATP